MRHPLVRRATCSFAATAAALGLAYYPIAVSPAPSLWPANATADGGMLVQALSLAVLYGVPAWALAYLVFGLLGIPEDRRKFEG